MCDCLARKAVSVFCACRKSAPYEGDLEELEPIKDKSPNEDTVFMFQILEGIKLAAAARVQAEPLLDGQQGQGVSYNLPASLGVVVLKDYLPGCFRAIRDAEQIDTQDYINSWSYAFKDLPSMDLGAGRSGSRFVFSADRKFMFKTLPAHEVETLKDIARDYRRYIQTHPQSRIMRFLALHRFRRGNEYLYVVIMNNILFSHGLKLGDMFDLKGRIIKPSSAKKLAGSSEKAGGMWKDNQLHRKFMPTNNARALQKALEDDAKFLCSQNCIDYSLLVGVHTVEENKTRDGNAEGGAAVGGALHKGNGKSFAPVHGSWDGKQEIYFVGVIDFLSRWAAKKKIANFMKRFLWKPQTLSTVPPTYYRDRWLAYIPQIVVEGNIPSPSASV